jgi:hypothetical protein
MHRGQLGGAKYQIVRKRYRRQFLRLGIGSGAALLGWRLAFPSARAAGLGRPATRTADTIKRAVIDITRAELAQGEMEGLVPSSDGLVLADGERGRYISRVFRAPFPFQALGSS